MPPPRFSTESAERLQRVLDATDTAVDSGSPPDVAVAKAAREHALPVGHIRLAVQAFNTGRAVRQLGEADPWTKAATYPQATTEGVIGILSKSGEVKTAAVTSDYHLPPGGVPTVKKASFVLPQLTEEPTPVPKVEADNTLGLTFKVASILDDIFGVLKTAPAGTYAAVKAAGIRQYPDAATFVFSRLESEDPRAMAKAAAEIDPTVPTNTHSVLVGLAKLAEVKTKTIARDYEGTVPKGWQKLAGAPGWLVKAAPTRTLDLPLDPTPLVAETATTDAILAANPQIKAAAMFGGVSQIPWSAAGSLLRSQTLRGLTNIHPGGAAGSTGLSGRQEQAIDAGMAATDQQAAVQELLTDNRFRTADPKVIVATYRQLHSLAPRAMQNPAVAADYVHRRIQTGPLSSYDLKTITDIEKNLASVNRGSNVDDD